MKILVIIPCYNEQDNIVQVIQNLKAEYPQADYVVVNDCSTDNSETVLKENNFNYISLPVNLGIGGGVQSGYMYAVERGYDITIQMDGDGQHNPKYLKDVIDPVANGQCDMCIGSRFITKEGFQTSTMRRLGIVLLSKVIHVLCGAKIKDVTSGFRACNKELTKFFSVHYAQDYPEPEAIITSVLAGYTLAEAPVVMEERQSGQSSISPLKGAYYMLKVGLALIIMRIIGTDKKGGTANE